MGYLLGSGIVGGSDEYFSPIDESHLFSVGRYGGRACSAVYFQVGNVLCIVAYDVDNHFLWLPVGRLSIDFTIVSIAEGVVAVDGKESYRVGIERCYRLDILWCIHRECIYIHGAPVAFAQEI